jgi:hypothetical protein
VIEVKEIKFRPKVDEHDYQFKKNHIERFIEEGDKVKATIFFRGREMAHPEIGHRILMRLIEDLAEVAQPETMPRMEGNQMHTILTQKKGASSRPEAGAPETTDAARTPEPTEVKMAKKVKLKTHRTRAPPSGSRRPAPARSPAPRRSSATSSRASPRSGSAHARHRVVAEADQPKLARMLPYK